MNNTTIQNIRLTTLLWVISCNEKSTLVTFQSIIDKSETINIEVLQDLVQLFPELFTYQVTTITLEEWKRKMLNNGSSPHEFDKISTNDVYGNQFVNSSGSNSINDSIIKWGINHISEYFVEKERRRKLKPSFIPSIFLMLIFALFLFMVLKKSTYELQFAETKSEIKTIELNSNIIYPSYKGFVDRLGKTLIFDLYYNNTIRNNELYYCRIELYKLMPFIDKKDFDAIDLMLKNYQKLITKYNAGQDLSEHQKDEIINKYSMLIKNSWEAILNQQLKISN
ncbi:hypothetical protein BTO06_10280 [Tenacibaculum sp. SZ-18]|uniref:hypothetical protein n=1 Tax=Tenacibaculum sp. SZ-18 TaxID=754423 RepID=UPI000C2D1288|nr:hypothetical protein [Tenacibaculum sp. SZ-18]AUC15503.1 hypothetical protein BTO06_10280 [Tenacibaculum sp. SZ-18]